MLDKGSGTKKTFIRGVNSKFPFANALSSRHKQKNLISVLICEIELNEKALKSKPNITFEMYCYIRNFSS